MKSQKEREYFIKLQKFINQINRENILSIETQKMLDEAARWLCPSWDEKLLLNDLIDQVKEYIELEKKLFAQNYTPVEHNKWLSYVHLFTEIQNDLRESSINTLLDRDNRKAAFPD